MDATRTRDDEQLEALLLRVVELLAQVVESLARIEARQERANELLDRIDRTQWS